MNLMNPSTSSTSTQQIVQQISSSPVQVNHLCTDENLPKNYVFPKHNNKRSFLKQWFNIFGWLEYDATKDRAFCQACIKFSNCTKLVNFTKTGFNDWVHAMNAFKTHENSSNHRKCFESYLIRNRGLN